ncbi:MAG: protein-L-isoaspartate(D-aspartate) O-methyltransferase [Bacteroidales bacterium]
MYRIFIISTIAIVMAFYDTGQAYGQEEEYQRRRLEMVKRQLEPRGITNEKVLNAFRTVPRHLFIPAASRSEAYGDHPVGIEDGQTISQPYIVAYMTEAIGPESGMKLLEIGTGSGYQAAILSLLVDTVYTIEISATLAGIAEKRLKELGYGNVVVRHGDGYRGWPEKAPFDAILVTCAPSEIPEPLTDQLKTGGKLVIPYGPSYNQVLKVFVKEEVGLKELSRLPVQFVPMTGPGGWKY